MRACLVLVKFDVRSERMRLSLPYRDFVAQLFNECGAAVWGTSLQTSDALEFHARWGILSQDVRDVEVVWSPVHRDALGRLLLEQLQASSVMRWGLSLRSLNGSEGVY